VRRERAPVHRRLPRPLSEIVDSREALLVIQLFLRLLADEVYEMELRGVARPNVKLRDVTDFRQLLTELATQNQRRSPISERMRSLVQTDANLTARI
jgi:hypothetical protein